MVNSPFVSFKNLNQAMYPYLHGLNPLQLFYEARAQIEGRDYLLAVSILEFLRFTNNSWMETTQEYPFTASMVHFHLGHCFDLLVADPARGAQVTELIPDIEWRAANHEYVAASLGWNPSQQPVEQVYYMIGLYLWNDFCVRDTWKSNDLAITAFRTAGNHYKSQEKLARSVEAAREYRRQGVPTETLEKGMEPGYANQTAYRITPILSSLL